MNERNRRRPAMPPVEEIEGQLEGRNALTEALRSGRTIDKVFIAAGDTDRALQHLAATAKEAGAVVVPVDRRKLDAMSYTRAHQGVIALAAAREDIVLFIKQLVILKETNHLQVSEHHFRPIGSFWPLIFPRIKAIPLKNIVTYIGIELLRFSIGNTVTVYGYAKASLPRLGSRLPNAVSLKYKSIQPATTT